MLFRDFLNENDDVKNQYCTLKICLANEYGNDRDTYTKKKTEFILKVIEKAKASKEDL